MKRPTLRSVQPSAPNFGLRPIWRMWCLAWWRWARNELSTRDPMHPDLPMIVRKVNELEAA